MTEADDLARLYRETILEHSRHPRHFGRMPDPDARADGNNPLCGDRLTVYLKLDDDTITDTRFEGVGCAICMASASIMAERVTGGTTSAARDGIADLESMLGGEESVDATDPMAALAGVRSYPSRVRCATLPWKSLQAALDGLAETVTTED